MIHKDGRPALTAAMMLACFAWAFTGCSDSSSGGGAPAPDAGDPGDAPDGGGEDPGPLLSTLEYTPAGCDYSVSTPEVLEHGMSEEVLGTTPDIAHVHVGFAGPPDSTVAVNWKSDLETHVSTLLWGSDQAAVEAANAAGNGVQQQQGHFMRYAQTVGTAIIDDGAMAHEVHLCGLSPDTTYFYKVGGMGRWSDTYSFTTAPAPGSDASRRAWTFAASGDARDNVENVWPLAQRRIRDKGVALQIFSGDAVGFGPIQQNWDDFFGASTDDGAFVVEDFLAEVPFMPANGNHDVLAVNYLSQFVMPQQIDPGEGSQGEEWYSFDYGNAHFIVLNDSVLDADVISGAETDWLRADLQSVDREKTPWVFAYHHKAFHTCRSRHGPEIRSRLAWQPLFDEFEVDIVFTGHNHVYERTLPIRGLVEGEAQLAAADESGAPVIGPDGKPSGTLYVTSGSVGAPPYSASDSCDFTHIASVEPNFVTVTLEDRTLTFTAWLAKTDQVLETFTYTK